MGENRLLRPPRGSSRVLEQRDVVRVQAGLDERVLRAAGQRLAEADRVIDTPPRNHAPDVFDGGVHNAPRYGRKEIADLCRDHVREADPGQRLLECVREVLEHDDRFRAGIAELLLEFARGVEGIDVHDHEARAQNAEEGNRVLQDVRQHDGDAFALAQSQSFLKKSAEVS